MDTPGSSGSVPGTTNGATGSTNAFAALSEDVQKHMIAPQRKVLGETHPKRTTKLFAADKLPAACHGKETRGDVLYPEFLPVDAAKGFSLAKVHSGPAANMYRQKDLVKFSAPGSKREVVGKREKYKAKIVASNNGVNHVALGYAGNIDPDTSKHAIDPRDVSVSIVPYTQRPFVQVDIVMERESHADYKEQKAKKVVKWYCYANSLTRGPSAIGILMEAGTSRSSPSGHADIDQHQQQKTLGSVLLELLPVETVTALLGQDQAAVGRPTFTGISAHEVHQLAVRHADNDQTLTPAMKLIATLHTATHVGLYFQVNEPNQPAFREANEYMRVICYACAQYDFFWWYTLAAQALCGSDTKVIRTSDVDFPFSAVPPPRWLCTKFAVFYENDKIVGFEPTMWTEGPMVRSPIHPSVGSFAFENRLAIGREVHKNEARLNQLANLGNNKILGTFFGDGKTDTYLVTIKVLGSATDGKSFPQPDFGRSIHVDLNYNFARVKMNGVVIANPFEAGQNFTVAATPHQRITITPGYETEVTIGFPADTTATTRVMNAIASLERGQNRRQGMHCPTSALGGQPPPGHKFGWLSEYLAGENRTQLYKNEIARHTLNATQLEAAMQPLTPSCDEQLIWGPAGTGKTTGSLAIVKGLLRAGLKVVVTASSNAAVDRALEAFVDPKNKPLEGYSLPAHFTFARFAGAVSRKHIKVVKPPSEYDNAMIVEQEVVETANDDNVDLPEPLRGSWDDEFIADADAKRDLLMNNAFEMIALNAGKNVKTSEHSFAEKLHDWVRFVSGSPMPVAGPEVPIDEAASARVHFERKLRRWHACRRYFELYEGLLTGDWTARQDIQQARQEFKRLNEEISAFFLSDKVRILFGTNSSMGHPLIAGNFWAKVGFHDEGGQSPPADSMIPMASMKERIRYQIWVGDHKQLKPVCTSVNQNEASTVMRQSILERKMDQIADQLLKIPMVMYDTQYRFHPDLCDFPSKAVYDGKLKTDPSCQVETELDRLVFKALAPIKLEFLWNGRRRLAIDVSNDSVKEEHRLSFDETTHAQVVMSEKFQGSPSSFNPTETIAIMQLVLQLLLGGVAPEKIAIIIPYTGGRMHMEETLRNQRQAPEARKVSVLSTDSSQGREADIVILGHTVNVAGNAQNLGFIWEDGKVVVGTTRPRRFLFLVGNFKAWFRSGLTKEGFYNQRDCRLFKSFVNDIFEKKDIIPFEAFRARMNNEIVQINTVLDGPLRPLPPPPRFVNAGNPAHEGEETLTFSNKVVPLNTNFDRLDPVGNAWSSSLVASAGPSNLDSGTGPKPAQKTIYKGSGVQKGRGRGGGRGRGRGRQS